MLGAYGEAEAALRESLVTAERMGLTSAAAIARQNLGLTLAVERLSPNASFCGEATEEWLGG